MIRYGIVTHGGAGAPAAWRDGCEKAAEAGLRVLESAGHALDAVIEAAVSLEEDGRFNAGRGAVLRLDGRSIETDASLMDSTARLGIVAGLRDVPHPIRAARRVMDTPHVFLAGGGARRFAEMHGLVEHFEPSAQARESYARVKSRLGAEDGSLRPEWQGVDLKTLWNFPVPYEEVFPCDTIGAVALDREGRFAVANSTGGASPMLCGRVGDSPIIGCGFYCSPAGAVAATGIGEWIIKRMLSRGVHDEFSRGESVERACRAGVEPFGDVPVGVIAIHRSGWATAANRPMPVAALVRTDE